MTCWAIGTDRRFAGGGVGKQGISYTQFITACLGCRTRMRCHALPCRLIAGHHAFIALPMVALVGRGIMVNTVIARNLHPRSYLEAGLNTPP